MSFLSPLRLLELGRDNRLANVKVYQHKIETTYPTDPNYYLMATYVKMHLEALRSYDSFCRAIEILKHRGTT